MRAATGGGRNPVGLRSLFGPAMLIALGCVAPPSAAVTLVHCGPPYYLLLEDGSQTMLTPAEFEKRFGWKNDSSKVPQLPGM